MRGPCRSSILLGDEGQQSDLTGPLDGLGQLALMHGAGAGGSAGQNLGPLGNEAAQLGGILVVDATRQIGNFVYVPKKEIDNLYKGVKR